MCALFLARISYVKILSNNIFHVRTSINRESYTFFTPPAERGCLRNKVASKKDFKHIYIRLVCKQTTLKINGKHFTTVPNANILQDESERSPTTGVTCVLLDVSCSSCSLANRLASHSSKIYWIRRIPDRNVVEHWIAFFTRNKPMESGLTRRAGTYVDPGYHRYMYISRVVGAISEPGMGPYIPRVCDGTAPHRLVSLYDPPTRVGGRCGAPTDQRF